MRADVVVVVREGVELPLQLRGRLGGGLLGQIARERLVQALHLATSLRVIGREFLKATPRRSSSDSKSTLPRQ